MIGYGMPSERQHGRALRCLHQVRLLPTRRQLIPQQKFGSVPRAGLLEHPCEVEFNRALRNTELPCDLFVSEPQIKHFQNLELARGKVSLATRD